MKTVRLRNIEIGMKVPKVCVPIVGKTFSEVIEQAERISPMGADLVEWRADCCDFYSEREQVEAVLVSIREILEDTPILFTFRSRQEGGNQPIGGKEYLELNRFAIQEGMADMIDVELSHEDEIVDEIIRTAHRAKIPVILSSHNFERTPDPAAMTETLKEMEKRGADFAKLAVMPNCERDVLNLLCATLDAREQMDIPVVTMAMGGIGIVSRLSGECFGSALTFGCVGKASAPGQVELKQLKATLELIHRGITRSELEQED